MLMTIISMHSILNEPGFYEAAGRFHPELGPRADKAIVSNPQK
jgi:hypothetical protein